MNGKEFKTRLAAQGCTFETKRCGSDQLIVRRGAFKSELPMHGGGKELGSGLVNAINETALVSMIDDNDEIPRPKQKKRGDIVVELPLLTGLKISLYWEIRRA